MTTTTPSGARGTSVATDIAYIAVFAALISVLGFVAIPIGSAGVPIVLQNVATILAGLVLGGRRGFFATGLFLLISIAFPVLAGGRTLIQAFAGPTIGYLLGYLLGAAAAGSGLTYVPPGFTADQDLSVLPAAEPVIVRGFGLAFIDPVVLDRSDPPRN